MEQAIRGLARVRLDFVCVIAERVVGLFLTSVFDCRLDVAQARQVRAVHTLFEEIEQLLVLKVVNEDVNPTWAVFEVVNRYEHARRVYPDGQFKFSRLRGRCL